MCTVRPSAAALWWTALLLAVLPLPSGAVSAAGPPPPNIVLIIGDDIGWMDFGFMGSDAVRTPNLDRLAESGTVFTHAFAPSSVCRPSLLSLLTGLTPQAATFLLNRDREGNRAPVPIREVVETLPASLAERGYASFQGGKHWEGTFEDAGFTHGMTRTLEPPVAADGSQEDTSFLWRSGSEGLALGRETMEPLFDFLAAHRDEPFFVWYAPMLPHQPFDAPAAFSSMYADSGAPEYVRGYRANLTRLDATVGALLGRVADLGLSEKTLVVYVSDNGWDSSAAGLVGGPRGKSTLHELGVRTPLVVSWPGHVAAGVRDDRLVSLLDVYPTLVDFAGAQRGIVAGRSLHPLLTRGGHFHREYVVGGSGRKGRKGRFLRTATWRYISGDDGSESLYLIEKDPREENDLASAHPELLQGMRRELIRELSGANRHRSGAR